MLEGIYPRGAWAPVTRIESLAQSIFGSSKEVNRTWTPFVIELRENHLVKLPVRTIHDLGSVICCLIKVFGDPINPKSDNIVFETETEYTF